jgi:hypothetical protein
VARSKATFGSYLVALVMLAVIPLMLIAGVLIWRQTVLQRQAFERSLLQTAQALSLAVDRQIFADRVMLETLARSPLLDRGDIRGFYALCARVSAEHGACSSRSSTTRASSSSTPCARRARRCPRPSSSRRPRPRASPIGDPSAIQEVLRTGKPVNSDLVYGLVAGRLIFLVNVPVIRGKRIRYVLNAGFEPQVMTRLLQESKQFAGVPAWIWDRRGFIVGRWQNADQYVGTACRRSSSSRSACATPASRRASRPRASSSITRTRARRSAAGPRRSAPSAASSTARCGPAGSSAAR